jgi:hypothetical protein
LAGLSGYVEDGVRIDPEELFEFFCNSGRISCWEVYFIEDRDDGEVLFFGLLED